MNVDIVVEHAGICHKTNYLSYASRWEIRHSQDRDLEFHLQCHPSSDLWGKLTEHLWGDLGIWTETCSKQSRSESREDCTNLNSSEYAPSIFQLKLDISLRTIACRFLIELQSILHKSGRASPQRLPFRYENAKKSRRVNVDIQLLRNDLL